MTKIPMRSASAIHPGRYVQTEQDVVGVVVERGQTDPNANDPTAPVRVLVLDPGRGGNGIGEVATVGGMELVNDLGPVPVPKVSISYQNEES